MKKVPWEQPTNRSVPSTQQVEWLPPSSWCKEIILYLLLYFMFQHISFNFVLRKLQIIIYQLKAELWIFVGSLEIY